MNVDYAEILDTFLWGMDTLTNPTFGNLVGGYGEYDARRRSQLLRRMQEAKLIEWTGRGTRATFTITATGLKRAAVTNPRGDWDRPWDGAWRVVTFDVPEVRRKDRVRLWQALRARKLGLLQRSVWIWPRPVESMLLEIIRAEGVPECFCGFETRRVFLCTDAEVVESAWDFEEITRRQQSYLKHSVANIASLNAARDFAKLVTVARVERQAYQYAFSVDPLLPRELWPKPYRGASAQAKHEEFRAALRRRFTTFAK